MEKKIENLMAYCEGMLRKESGKELYDEYLDDIKSIIPQDIFKTMNEMLEKGYTPSELLTIVDKLMNVFYSALNKYDWENLQR